MKTDVHLWSYLAQFFSEWENFQTKVVEKIKTRILFSIPVPPHPENHAVYEVMWKNIVGPDRPQMSIWRMRISCWIAKATYTYSECVILIAYPRQQWFTDASHCYVIHTLPVLKNLSRSVWCLECPTCVSRQVRTLKGLHCKLSAIRR